MDTGNLKLTQREVAGKAEATGRKRQVYFKSDIEEKALKYCEEQNISMSLLIRLAIEKYLERQG